MIEQTERCGRPGCGHFYALHDQRWNVEPNGKQFVITCNGRPYADAQPYDTLIEAETAADELRARRCFGDNERQSCLCTGFVQGGDEL